MKSTQYTMIRVPVETARRLRMYAGDLEDQAGQLKLRLPDKGNTGRCECPLWFAVDTLLDKIDRHRARARRASASKRKGRIRPESESIETSEPPALKGGQDDSNSD